MPGAGGEGGLAGSGGNPSGGTGGNASTGGTAGRGEGGNGGGPATGGASGSGGAGGIARPSADNTGPHSPGLLTPQSPGEITVDGTVIENADMTGTIHVKADNVTIRNFRINGGLFGIKVEDGHTGIVFEDGEIYNSSAEGILGVGYAARRLHIHDTGKNGIKPQGSTPGSTLIESCFIDNLGTNADAHANGIRSEYSAATLTVRYNNIYMPYPGTPDYPGAPYKSNSTFHFDGNQVGGNSVDSNWLVGGNYTIFCVQDSGSVAFTNNIFGRYNAGWVEGKEAQRIRTGTCGGAWTNNRWEDTGELVP